MQFTPATLRPVDAAIMAALKSVEAQFGISIKMGRGTYDRSGKFATVKLELCSEVGRDPAEMRAEESFRVNAKGFGLEPEWLGKTTMHKGVAYTIVGLEPSRAKFPVRVKGPDGKAVLLTVEGVRVSFGLPANPWMARLTPSADLLAVTPKA